MIFRPGTIQWWGTYFAWKPYKVDMSKWSKGAVMLMARNLFEK